MKAEYEKKDTSNKNSSGEGFTHKIGDSVRISTPKLGTLINRVNTTDRVSPWTYGVRALMKDIYKTN